MNTIDPSSGCHEILSQVARELARSAPDYDAACMDIARIVCKEMPASLDLLVSVETRLAQSALPFDTARALLQQLLDDHSPARPQSPDWTSINGTQLEYPFKLAADAVKVGREDVSEIVAETRRIFNEACRLDRQVRELRASTLQLRQENDFLKRLVNEERAG